MHGDADRLRLGESKTINSRIKKVGAVRGRGGLDISSGCIEQPPLRVVIERRRERAPLALLAEHKHEGGLRKDADDATLAALAQI
jgi:hypothetical protein